MKPPRKRPKAAPPTPISGADLAAALGWVGSRREELAKATVPGSFHYSDEAADRLAAFDAELEACARDWQAGWVLSFPALIQLHARWQEYREGGFFPVFAMRGANLHVLSDLAFAFLTDPDRGAHALEVLAVAGKMTERAVGRVLKSPEVTALLSSREGDGGPRKAADLAVGLLLDVSASTVRDARNRR